MDSSRTLHRNLSAIGADVAFGTGNWVDVQLPVAAIGASKEALRRAGYCILSERVVGEVVQLRAIC